MDAVCDALQQLPGDEERLSFVREAVGDGLDAAALVRLLLCLDRDASRLSLLRRTRATPADVGALNDVLCLFAAEGARLEALGVLWERMETHGTAPSADDVLRHIDADETCRSEAFTLAVESSPRPHKRRAHSGPDPPRSGVVRIRIDLDSDSDGDTNTNTTHDGGGSGGHGRDTNDYDHRDVYVQSPREDTSPREDRSPGEDGNAPPWRPAVGSDGDGDSDSDSDGDSDDDFYRAQRGAAPRHPDDASAAAVAVAVPVRVRADGKASTEPPELRTPPGDADVSDADACVVCLERRKTLASIDCGHVCLCAECAAALAAYCARVARATRCPMCLAPLTRLIRVYT